MLYLESSSSVLEATKGTDAYTEIIDRLKKTNYAHQVDENDEEEKKGSVKDGAQSKDHSGKPNQVALKDSDKKDKDDEDKIKV